MPSGTSSLAMLSTFIDLPVSIPLGTVSLAGASINGVATALTKKNQKKVMKLADTVTFALAVFETSVSKALNDVKVDQQEFTMLQTVHLGVLDKLANVDCKMEAETRAQLQKSILEEINNLKKVVSKSNAS